MAYEVTADTVVIGCDVGKTHHQIHVIDSALQRIGRRRISNTVRDVDDVFEWVKTLSSDVVLVVDQKASFAALVRHRAAVHDVVVLYVTGLQARRAADLTPGRAKTDRIDAQVIAEFGRAHAHRLPTLGLPDESRAAMSLLLGRDEDLRCDFNRAINRIRDLLTAINPELETSLGRRLTAPGVLAALVRWGNPANLARARTGTIEKVIAEHNPRMAHKVADLMRHAARQTLDVAAIDITGELISRLAHQAIAITTERNDITQQLEQLATTHDDYHLLLSIPGMGPKTTPRTMAEIGDISRFPTPDHLASYAGLAPINKQSGSALHTVHRNQAGNHRLKNALFLAAFVATRSDPRAAACYQQQRNKGKHHNAAIIAVARKRCDIIWAILTTQTPYKPLTT